MNGNVALFRMLEKNRAYSFPVLDVDYANFSQCIPKIPELNNTNNSSFCLLSSTVELKRTRNVVSSNFKSIIKHCQLFRCYPLWTQELELIYRCWTKQRKITTSSSPLQQIPSYYSHNKENNNLNSKVVTEFIYFYI